MRGPIAAILVGSFLLAATSLAQRPRQNINPQLHPNLAAAQGLVDQAFIRVTQAQKANEFDLAGHAEKAKALLAQANSELKLAAQASNRR